MLRQSQEGFHGFAKDDAHEALGASAKRRKVGRTAQSLMVAVLLAAAGVRKIRTFLANAEPDEGGRLRVPRVTRTGDHATTGLPPGAVPPREERIVPVRERRAA